MILDSEQNPQMFRNWKKYLLDSFVRCEFSALRFSSSKFRYQPSTRDFAAFGAIFPPARGCEDRLSIIKGHLPEQSRNVLDIGSNAGYYLFELAKLGYICHGLESDPDLVHYTALASYLQKAKGVSCEWGRLDLSYAEHMPCYDVILCLSVMHHIILAEGMNLAEGIGKVLARKTKYVMFYEMGQSNEIEADWSARLPRMEPDPETWIAQWLKQCGFRRVETIGTSSTTVPRFLFAAYP
jgi:hypothetical protein